jgi:hypothetical protein
MVTVVVCRATVYDTLLATPQKSSLLASTALVLASVTLMMVS